MATITVEITNEDILNILKDKKFKKLENFKIVPLSAKVLGLWGDHYILHIDTDLKSYDFFLKAIPKHNQKRLEFINETGFFERECEIYEKFFPNLSNLSQFKWAPKCLMVKKNNFIVLENLRNFQMIGAATKILDYDHYVIAVKYIASMHASFVIFEEENGDRLKKDAEKLIELSYPRNPQSIRAISFNNGVKALTKLIELIPKYKNSPNLQKIQESFPKVCRKLIEFVEPSKKYRNILCHGDLWINNLMFRYEEGKPMECKIIDFQFSRFSPPAMDLVTFIYSSSCKDFRKLHVNEILSIYCDMLENELKTHNICLKKLPRSEILESFNELSVAGLIESTIFAHLILPNELACKVMESSDEYGKFLSESREEICIEAFNFDDYRTRVTELLIELIDEFVL